MKVTIDIPTDDVNIIVRYMKFGTYLTEKEKAKIFDTICSNDILLHDIDLSKFDDEDTSKIKIGHWINVDYEKSKCSLCGFPVKEAVAWGRGYDGKDIVYFDYCPKCGKRMINKNAIYSEWRASEMNLVKIS